MSTETTESSADQVPVEPAGQSSAIGASASTALPRRSAPWLSLLGILLAAAALMLGGLLWQKLDFTQKELARRTQEAEQSVADTRGLAAQAESQSKELQARLAVAEVRLSEVSLQRSQLEELMLALSRTRDDNLVQDIESSLRLAQQQAQLTGSVQPMLAALQSADERIARAAQPRLNPVQRAIARDVQRIRAATVADVPSLVQRLDELVREVDHWPVPNEVGPRAAQGSKAAGVTASTPAAAKANAAQPGDAAVKEVPAGSAEPPVATGWSGIRQQWAAFWAKVWDDSVRGGKELVRVSRIDRPEAVLLAPEQAFFLRENLKLRLLNARLGLLARQMAAVQDDLKLIDAALARHFDTRSPQVIAAQALVTQLRAEVAFTELPQPVDSLAALTMAAGGR